jgi:hypothetical protein
MAMALRLFSTTSLKEYQLLERLIAMEQSAQSSFPESTILQHSTLKSRNTAAESIF